MKKINESFEDFINEGKKTKIIVWTDDNKKKKTIDLDASQLQKTVSSGHDNDWNRNIDKIKQHIDRGDKEGTTNITRYHGAPTDTVYWELKESVNEDNKYEVFWIDRNYKSGTKLFSDNPQGAPENGLKKAKLFLKKLEDADKKDNYGLYRSLGVRTISEGRVVNEGKDKFPKSFVVKDTLHYSPMIDGKSRKLLKGTYKLKDDKGDTAIYWNQAFKSEIEIDHDDVINFERTKSHFKVNESVNEAKKYRSYSEHLLDAPAFKDRPDTVKNMMKDSLNAMKRMQKRVEKGDKGTFTSFSELNSSTRIPKGMMVDFLQRIIDYYEKEIKFTYYENEN